VVGTGMGFKEYSTDTMSVSVERSGGFDESFAHQDLKGQCWREGRRHSRDRLDKEDHARRESVRAHASSVRPRTARGRGRGRVFGTFASVSSGGLRAFVCCGL